MRLCELSHLLSFILVDAIALINKLAEELLTAAVTDIRVLAIGGPNGDVQRTRDAEDAGQTEEHRVLDILHFRCQTSAFQTVEPTGESNLYLTGEVLGDELFLGDLVRTPGTHVLRLRTLRYASIALDANMQARWSLIGFHDVELAHIYDRGNAIYSRLLSTLLRTSLTLHLSQLRGHIIDVEELSIVLLLFLGKLLFTFSKLLDGFIPLGGAPLKVCFQFLYLAFPNSKGVLSRLHLVLELLLLHEQVRLAKDVGNLVESHEHGLFAFLCNLEFLDFRLKLGYCLADKFRFLLQFFVLSAQLLVALLTLRYLCLQVLVLLLQGKTALRLFLVLVLHGTEMLDIGADTTFHVKDFCCQRLQLRHVELVQRKALAVGLRPVKTQMGMEVRLPLFSFL